MISYSAGYSSNLDRTKHKEHFDYILVDLNKNEHLIKYEGKIESLNSDVIVSGVEYSINNDSNYDGCEVHLQGKLLRKPSDITISNLVNYVVVKKIDITNKEAVV